MNAISASAFSQIVATTLTGAAVQEAKCGPGTGSIVNLHLHSPTGRLYLMIFCSWKILQHDTILCSWKDSESLIEAAFLATKDLRVLSAHVAPGGDLVLDLEAGVRIYLFSDSAIPEEVAIESDYFVAVRATIYTCLRGEFYEEEAAVH